MKTDREWILDALQTVTRGQPLKRYTSDTIYKPGRCAQLCRETLEGALGIPANTWEVATLAHDYRKKRHGVDRWASDYESAARKLGLNKRKEDLTPGDVLFWPYTSADGNSYGHVAIYAGDVPGMGPCALENTDWNPARRVADGARQPLGLNTRVFLTPLRLFGEPSTVATPTLAILKAEGGEIDTPSPTPPLPPVASVPSIPALPPKPALVPPALRVMVNTGQGVWKDAVGKTIRITGADEVVINTTDPHTFWIRYLDKEN